MDDLEISDGGNITTLSKSNLCTEGIPKNLNADTDYMFCKICFKEEMATAFIPCGHVFACIQCTVFLDQCAVCRQPSDKITRVYINKAENKDIDLQKLTQDSEKPLNPGMCKVCNKKEMQALFLPCKHIYSCIDCATKTENCVICSKPYLCIIQVYIL